MSGIIVAGTILTDKILETASYPPCGSLAEVKKVSRSVGGCVPNVAISLKKISPVLKVAACGRVGKDADGDFLLGAMAEYGIDVSDILRIDGGVTSFTSAISVSGGERTFFTYAGVCADFCEEDVRFEKGYDWLHLGYLLLLEKMDAGGAERLLARAKAEGLTTSVDFVSKAGGNYKAALSALGYCDNLIINETEASNLTGITVTDKNSAKAVCEKLKEAGVKERVILHMPDCGVMLTQNGFFVVPSLELPKGYIVGATGAGDAFCAGCLYKLSHGAGETETLEFASCCAAACLGAADSVSGVSAADEAIKLRKKYPRRKICW